MPAVRVLLVGYNGANNTGAEALLLSDIEDIRTVFGPDVQITVPSFNPANLKRYLREAPNIRIVPVPSIFFPSVNRLVKSHDFVMLVEGSTYMDTWTSALLWAFLWATRCAHVFGKPVMAYSVDAGEMRSRFNRTMVRKTASKTDLIVVRSWAATRRLQAWGVNAPMVVTADNTFNFRINPEDQGWPRRVWPQGAGRTVGFALVDFYRWPVVVRPWGRREDCYRWPYYFSRSSERQALSESLACGFAEQADTLVEEHGKTVAFICMEQLDEPFAHSVHSRMIHASHARVFSSREYNASQLTVLLRSLDILVTSRYHACVLSLASAVPQIAVGHDLRLRTIYDELGLLDGFFVEADPATLFENLGNRVRRLLDNPGLEREVLVRGYRNLRERAKQNREELRNFARKRGWI